MTKKIKLGLSAMVAFAMMFATSVSVVAQEKIAASDNVEAMESVKAIASASQIHKLHSIQANNLIAVAKDKNEPNTKKLLTPQWYERVRGDGTHPSDYEPLGQMDPGCTDGSQICAVYTIPGDDEDEPDPTELARILNENPPGGTPDDLSEVRFKD